MRIAWFSPYSNKSAIGRFSEAVLGELSKFASVDLWHCEAGDIRECPVRAVRFKGAAAIDLAKLSEYDLNIFNLGNHLPFHRDIFQVSRLAPGITIVHDFVMHHFFAAYYLEEMKNPDAYVSAMLKLYGDAGRVAAEDSLKAGGMRVWETPDVTKFPFCEDAVRGAFGVVTHSDFLRARIETSYPGPVSKIPLAYTIPGGGAHLSRKALDISETAVLIVTVGHGNRNKRLDEVIRAVAGCRDLENDVIFAVVGPVDPEYHRQLQATIAAIGTPKVRFVGYASDEMLRSYLAHADICVNLRFPAIEGASASAIEEMLYGKAVIVTDTGFFSELPDDCVIKIHPDREEQELTDTIKKLAVDRGLRDGIGARAQRYAQQVFHPARYAKELFHFCWQVRNTKPLLQLADKLAAELHSMGIHREMEILDTVSTHCHELFAREEASQPNSDPSV